MTGELAASRPTGVAEIALLPVAIDDVEMHRVAVGLADTTHGRLAGAARGHAESHAVGAAQLHHAAIAVDLAWPLLG